MRAGETFNRYSGRSRRSANRAGRALGEALVSTDPPSQQTQSPISPWTLALLLREARLPRNR